MSKAREGKAGTPNWSVTHHGRESQRLGDCGQCEITRHRNGTVTREVRVATWQTEQDALDTWVHEAMHGIWPDKAEAEVASASAELSGLLWRLGYRRPD